MLKTRRRSYGNCLLEAGWIKVNFDGASRVNPGPSGIGALAEGEIGSILPLSVKRIADGTNN